MEKNKDYSEKIFRGKTLNEIVNLINGEVENDFSLVEENDGIKKWNTLPILLIETKDKSTQIDEFITYVDEMLISEKEKISYLITLSSLVEHGKLKLDSLEKGHILTLVDFFRTKTVKEITKYIRFINNNDLIWTVRNKTVDIEIRTEILNYVFEHFVAEKIDRSHRKDFLAKMIDMIQSLDYYKLLDAIREGKEIEEE